MKYGYLLRGLLVLATLAGVGLALKYLGAAEFLNQDWIDAEVKGQGLWGEVLFLGVSIVFTAFGLPRQAVSFLGGYAFGFLFGTVLGVVATTGGCILTFYYARVLGREAVLKRAPRRIQRIDDFLSGQTFSMTLLIRLLPVGSNLLTNMAAGVTGIRPAAFFAGSALGYIPQTMVFALAGSGVNLDPGLRIGLSVVLFVVSALLGVYLYRKYRHGKRLGADVEAVIGDNGAS